MADAKRFKEIDNAKYWHEIAQKYLVFYPNNKFISWSQARDICKKYGLELTGVENYTGTIPEKNLREIEQFNLREKDAYYDDFEEISKREYDKLPEEERSYATTGADHHICGYYKAVKRRYGFCICAPKKDISIPDAVVLQTVEDGYLIVTAWGDEAADEIVVNEKMN